MEGQADTGGNDQVTRVFDRYGTQEKDAAQVRDAVAAAAGVIFSRIESDSRGDYYYAVTGRGTQIEVESNEAADELGLFYKDEDAAAAGYETLILAWHKAPTHAAAEEVLGELRDRLAAVQELEFLNRQRGQLTKRRSGGRQWQDPAG